MGVKDEKCNNENEDDESESSNKKRENQASRAVES